MPEPVACTIVSNNYLGFARVLAKSFLAQHPAGSIYVLIVDEPAEEIDYATEPFDVIFADQLDIPSFSHFAFKYTLLELNTAVKPFFLQYLHVQKSVSAVFYFDPDIWVLDDLLPLLQKLETNDLLLTPHLLEPLEDDRRPSERDILLAGVYNLGFLGIRFNQDTLRFLEWWQKRLYSHCLHRVSEGLFVDQRWMDLAVGFLDGVGIIRDPEYNVAYWNLAQRPVERRDNAWWVNNRPLRFFHFSGFDIDDPESISRHQNRFTLSDLPALGSLFRCYREQLQAAGFDQLRRVSYAYGVFDNLIPIPDFVRGDLRRMDASGDRWSDPFATDHPGSYLDWLQAPIRSQDDTTSLPRICLLLWEAREDLQREFPAPLSVDHANYASWLVSGEAAASGLDPTFPSTITFPLDTSLANSGPLPTERQKESQVNHSETTSASRYDMSALAADAAYDSSLQPCIPRMAMLIWDARPDLREAFTAPLGQSRQAFARWYTTFAKLEYDLPESLVAPTLQSMNLGDRWRSFIWHLMARTGRIRTIPQASWRHLASFEERDNLES